MKVSRRRIAALSAALALTTAPYAAAGGPAGIRSAVDRPGTGGLRVHLVYLVTKGHKDRHYDTNGTLDRAAGQLQTWFARETGGRQIRLDTFHGRPDVTFVRSPRSSYVCAFTGDPSNDTGCYRDTVAGLTTGPSNDPVDLVAADLAAAGLQDPDVRYLVLVEGTAGGICGQSQEPAETDRDPAHVGHVAAVFLGDDLCPNDDPGSGQLVSWELAHEYLHNDGAVPDGAPHFCAATRDHVCTAGLGFGSPTTDPYDPERGDIMYPSPGVGLFAAHLDLGHDDYYGTSLGLRDVEDSPYFTPKR